ESRVQAFIGGLRDQPEMKVFHCNSCQHLIFFENVRCEKCSHQLAFLPDRGEVAALEPAEGELWRPTGDRSAVGLYRLCEHYTTQNVCNWAVAADDPVRFCISCRLNRMIPDLSQPGHQDAWYRLEVAKRRVIYTLLELGLSFSNKADDPQSGLAFEFLA